ncbi:MAG: OmpA family protein [Gammaproteobacteria bacterium]|nr:OmpA family protein [Gammaproteobacteria bacterium]
MLVALLGVLGSGLLQAAQFSTGVGGAWDFVEADGVCRLEHPVGDYGLARFTGVSGKPLRFEVLGHRDLFAPGPVNLFQVAPAWHADFPSDQLLGQVPHLAGGGVNVSDPVATRVLMALYEGFDAYVRRDGWYASAADPEVAVAVSSVNLRPLYEKFIGCFESVLMMDWAEVERTRVAYPVNVWEIDESALERLRAIAAYADMDSSVTAVFVDGHTDAIGSQRDNYRLSRRRADAVAEFLKSCGLAAELLTVRYHGAAYPVADNETDAGRAHNRRTTVRLERSWPELAAVE